jgi:hypothetical protein
MNTKNGPFDPSKTARVNLLEWTGEDERIMKLVKYCDIHGYPMVFNPGVDRCYIDVLAPNKRTICFGDQIHSMSIDLDDDIVLLFGDEDIDGGLAVIERAYAQIDTMVETGKLDRLLEL